MFNMQYALQEPECIGNKEMNAREYATAVDALAEATRYKHIRPVIDVLGTTINLAELPSYKRYMRHRKRHFSFWDSILIS